MNVLFIHVLVVQLIALLIDIRLPLGPNAGLLQVAALVAASKMGDNRATYRAALSSGVFVVVGWMLSSGDHFSETVIVNRLLALAVLGSAVLMLWNRTTELTQRVEAAGTKATFDRLKSIGNIDSLGGRATVFEEAFMDALNGAAIIKEDHTIFAVNNRFCELTGRAREELQSTKIEDQLPWLVEHVNTVSGASTLEESTFDHIVVYRHPEHGEIPTRLRIRVKDLFRKKIAIVTIRRNTGYEPEKSTDTDPLKLNDIGAVIEILEERLNQMEKQCGTEPPQQHG